VCGKTATARQLARSEVLLDVDDNARRAIAIDSRLVLDGPVIVRDLRVYAQASDATVLHYRDNTGLEVDAIVEVAAGRWAAFEVKLGQGQIDAAAALLTFVSRVDTATCNAPAALGVITVAGYGYQRPDGVHVIPIAALGP